MGTTEHRGMPIHNALIFLSNEPIQEAPKSGIFDSQIHLGYVPHLFRRRRLRRFARFGEALAAARCTYRWKRLHPATTGFVIALAHTEEKGEGRGG